MAAEPHRNMEGIRFLDETPKPTGPTGPASNPKPKRRKRREWPVGVLAFLAVVGGGVAMKWGGGPPGDASARDVIEERFEVGPAPRIEVDAFEGTVRVERGDDREVSCRVETKASGPTDEDAKRALGLIRTSIVGGPDAVRVRVDGPGGRSGKAEIRLEVPAGADVRIVTRNGSVRVEEVDGSIAVRTTNGRIEVEEARGPIVLQTSNGSIDCEARDAQVLAETSNGSIAFRGSLAPGSSRLSTSNGSVTLRLPEDGRYRIDAKTSNGKVDSDFALASGEIDRVLLAGIDGEEPGRSRIQIRTSNGAIRVKKD